MYELIRARGFGKTTLQTYSLLCDLHNEGVLTKEELIMYLSRAMIGYGADIDETIKWAKRKLEE